MMRTVLEMVVISEEKQKILEENGWFPTWSGGYSHPSGSDILTASDIAKMSTDDIRVACKMGSYAVKPEVDRERYTSPILFGRNDC